MWTGLTEAWAWHVSVWPVTIREVSGAGQDCILRVSAGARYDRLLTNIGHNRPVRSNSSLDLAWVQAELSGCAK